MTEQLTVQAVRDIESQSIGTMAYHKVNPFYSMVVTDGVFEIAKLGAFWLLDEIGLNINLHKELDKSFTVVELKVNDSKGTLIGKKENEEGEDVIFYTKEIPYTDFPCDIKLYLIDNVLLLVGEY